MTLDDGPTFVSGAGLRTVAFLATRSDAHGQPTDLAAVAAVCSDDGFLVDQLGDLLAGLPPDARPGSTADPEAPWHKTLGAALQGVDVVVAHDAWAQRQAAEIVHDGFGRLDWGCARAEIDWCGLGFPSDRLADIGARLGLSARGRRTFDRCHLLLAVLTQPGRQGHRPLLARVFAAVDAETVRLFVGDAPAVHMPALERRGYRWSWDEDGAPEGLFIDRRRDALDEERRFLARLLGRDEAELLERSLPASQRYRLP